MPESIATFENVSALSQHLADHIPLHAHSSPNNGVWTRAVYDSLREFANPKGWRILPADRCYAGEYLLDFMLLEDGYGCRVACESQWSHWRNDNKADLAWAFDKLRGVKSDLKVFIFEASEADWAEVQRDYLLKYAQISVDEAFLALRWEKDFLCERSWWKATIPGLQTAVSFLPL